MGQVALKHPFEQLGSAQADLRCGMWRVAVLIGGVRRVVRPAWDDLGPQGRIGREHAMEAKEMEPWTDTPGLMIWFGTLVRLAIKICPQMCHELWR